MTKDSCPDVDELAAFASGGASRDRARILDHLDHCEACRREVAIAAASNDERYRVTTSASPRSDASTGVRVGRFIVKRVLGEGAMGVVHLAYDPELKRNVAVKVIKPDSGDAQARERLFVEAQTAAQLSHPNAVTVYDVGMHDGQPYVAMEYVEGRTVAAWLKQGVSWREGLAVMLAAGEGLAAAHDAGLVHRDFKPDNVLLGAPGVVKVSDFGLARFADERLSSIAAHEEALALPRSSRAQTSTGVLVGTPAYTAPEQVEGAPATAASDQFAFGVAVYRALYGVRPFRAPTLYTLFEAITNDPPPPPPRDARAPRALWPVIERALSKKPANRYPSMRELLAALREASGVPIDALVERCPFPGLVSFSELDAPLYFGRALEVNEAQGRLRDQGCAAIIGPSGAGKSSFVRALVVPRLRAIDRGVEVLSLRPGERPLTALARLVAPLASASAQSLDELAAALRARPELLAELLAAHARHHDNRVIVCVDQLEELYTQVNDRAERIAFARCLAALEPGRSLLCVTLRSDFLDRVAECPALIARVTNGLVFLAPPGRTALVQSLTGPLATVGYELEDPAIAEEIAEEIEYLPGAFPLLQFVGGRLWDERDRERKLITRASLVAIGAVSGALAAHADRVLAQLTPTDAKLSRAILVRLVTADRTRLAVAVRELDELGAPAEVQRAVDALIRGRLLVADGETVELVHEALITNWPTLHRWLDDEADNARLVADLGASARRWDAAGRPEGMLWTGESARQIVGLAARGARMTALEIAFARSTEQLLRRAARRRRTLVIGALAIVSVIAVIATVAYFKVAESETKALASASEARTAAETAEAETRKAREAEDKARRALDDLMTAQATTEAANTRAATASAQVELTRDQLAQKAIDLERALAAANLERKKAQENATRLQAAVVTEQGLRTKLDEALKAANAARLAAEKRYREAISKLPPKDPL